MELRRIAMAAVAAFILSFALVFTVRAETRVINSFVHAEDAKTEYVENPYQTIPITDEEFEELRWVVALESQNQGLTGEEMVIETIFNRALSSSDWGGSIHGILSAKICGYTQFATYKYIGSPKAWAVPGELEDDAISNVLRNGPTHLPSMDYVYFSRGKIGKKAFKYKSHWFGAEK